jgi:hypothetical protein
MGITAKSTSKSFALFRYFSVKSSGFFDNDAQNTVSKRRIFKSPQMFFATHSRKQSLIGFNKCQEKRKEATHARARVTWESDSHSLSSFNRSTSIAAKFPKEGSRNLTPLRERMALVKKSKQHTSIVYKTLTLEHFSYSKRRIILSFCS